MARPKKTNAEYFSHDTDMRNDLRIKAIRRKFGLEGYAVWNMLLEVITDSDNLELEYNDEQIELISADFDIDTIALKQIVDYCIQLKLIVYENGVIYSETLKKRLDSLFTKRKQQLERFSSTKTQNKDVFVDENPQSKVKESKVKEIKVNESKENTYSDDEPPVCFQDTNIHFSLLEYFGFTEMRNPDKLQQVSTFLNILFTDKRIDQFTDQFEAYRQYKEKSATAKHSFPKFLGTIENRYLDGGWNQENWADRLSGISFKDEDNSPFNTSKTQSLRERIVNGAN
jgi:hypothetical protein